MQKHEASRVLPKITKLVSAVALYLNVSKTLAGTRICALMTILVLIQSFFAVTIAVAGSRQAASRRSAPTVSTATRKASTTKPTTSTSANRRTSSTPQVAVRKTASQQGDDFAKRIKSVVDGSGSPADKVNGLKKFIPKSVMSESMVQPSQEQETEEEGEEETEENVEEVESEEGEGEGETQASASAAPVISADEWPRALESAMGATQMFLAVAEVVRKHFADNNIDKISYTGTDESGKKKSFDNTLKDWKKIEGELIKFKDRLDQEKEKIPQAVVLAQVGYIQNLTQLTLAISKQIPELEELLENINKSDPKKQL